MCQQTIWFTWWGGLGKGVAAGVVDGNHDNYGGVGWGRVWRRGWWLGKGVAAGVVDGNHDNYPSDFFAQN